MLRGLDRIRCRLRVLYRGIIGYRLKPPPGFGRNLRTESELHHLLGGAGFRCITAAPFRDPSRSSYVPVEYVRAVRG